MADHQRASCSLWLLKNGSLPITSAPTPQLNQGRKDRIEVALGAGVQDMQLQPESAGRRLQVSRLGLCTGIGRVDEHRNNRRRGDQLAQQLQPLRPYLVQTQVVTPVMLPAGSVQAGDESRRDGVEPYRRRR